MQNKRNLLIGGGVFLLLSCVLSAVHYGREEGWSKFSSNHERQTDRKNGNTMMDHDSEMKDMMTERGISERQFIETMIPHHEEAIATAKFELKNGDNAEAKKLAENIITAQENEVADMKSWYKNWFGTEYKSDGTYKNMMPDLSALSGTKLDRAFLEGMIEHHTDALEENQRVVPNLQHLEMQTLVKNIAENQSSEIITMRILLKQI